MVSRGPDVHGHRCDCRADEAGTPLSTPSLNLRAIEFGGEAIDVLDRLAGKQVQEGDDPNRSPSIRVAAEGDDPKPAMPVEQGPL